jgi:hypothetical protein
MKIKIRKGENRRPPSFGNYGVTSKWLISRISCGDFAIARVGGPAVSGVESAIDRPAGCL